MCLDVFGISNPIFWKPHHLWNLVDDGRIRCWQGMWTPKDAAFLAGGGDGLEAFRVFHYLPTADRQGNAGNLWDSMTSFYNPMMPVMPVMPAMLECFECGIHVELMLWFLVMEHVFSTSCSACEVCRSSTIHSRAAVELRSHRLGQPGNFRFKRIKWFGRLNLPIARL